MKRVKFTLSLPEPMSGVMEYDDESFESARDSGEIYYHGLDFFQADEYLQLTWEEVDEDGVPVS